MAQAIGGMLAKHAQCNAYPNGPSSKSNRTLLQATVCSRKCLLIMLASARNENAATSASVPSPAVPTTQKPPIQHGRNTRKHKPQPSAAVPGASSPPPISGSRKHLAQKQWLNAWDTQSQAKKQAASTDGGQSKATAKPDAQTSASAQRQEQYVDARKGRRQSRPTPTATNPAVARAQFQKRTQALGINVDPSWTSSTVDASIFDRLHVPQPQPGLTTLQQIVIVEGYQDCKAVHKALNAVVYVCDGASIKSDKAGPDLQLLKTWPAGLIILTDPDAPGRELRMFLDDRLVQSSLRQAHRPAVSASQTLRTGVNAGASDQLASLQGSSSSSQERIRGISEPNSSRVLHAFVPVELATSTEASKWHEEGSTGIENASPAAISQGLLTARPSFHELRKEFTVQELQDVGLLNSFDSKQVAGAKLRRLKLCAKLGIDPCTGKSLCSMLNRFFTRDELDTALRSVDASIHEIDRHL